MANNGGPRVPPRPPAGVHSSSGTLSAAATVRTIPPPPPPQLVGGAAVGSTAGGHRAPAAMSVSLPPITAPLSPLGSRNHHLQHHHHQQQQHHLHLQQQHHPPPPPPPHHHRLETTTNGTLTRSATTTVVDRAATPTTPVTLTSPRPDGERVVNEYVETPFSRGSGTLNSISGSVVGSGINNNNNNNLNGGTNVPPVQQQSNNNNKQLVNVQQQHHRPDTLPITATVITKQPQATFTKSIISHQQRHHVGGPIGIGVGGGGGETPIIECHQTTTTRTSLATGNSASIICSECGRCRCESCQQPRPLPQRWVCDKKCLCSVDAVIDYTSCLCCVKGLFYHCSKDYELDRESGSCVDEPCSCAPHRRLMRWGCLLALTAALPCLVCYWPLRACARGIEFIYAQHTRSGCRCRPVHTAAAQITANAPIHHHHHSDTLTTPEKRLLDSSPDF